MAARTKSRKSKRSAGGKTAKYEALIDASAKALKHALRAEVAAQAAFAGLRKGKKKRSKRSKKSRKR